jgi:sugar phosphate isomerase/epimerase
MHFLMRIGVLARGEIDQLEWASHLGFRSIEWIRFTDSPCAPGNADWKPHALELGQAAARLDLRISAIGALYANPLDPNQTDQAREVFQRAIEVAALLGIRTVSGFPGAVIELEWSERGGNPVYKPFENYLPALLEFWGPLARRAADHGVRIAFEHCPQGAYHLPLMGCNMLAQPAMWERLFDASPHENLGIEWDPSHLICQFIDPVGNIEKFGSRIFHVHAKDAFIHRALLRRYGICHPGVAEHRMPGLGEANWPQIVHALLRAGYDSDLNVEGWHDPVYRDHPAGAGVQPEKNHPLAGRQLEETGLLIARRHLEHLVQGTG